VAHHRVGLARLLEEEGAETSAATARVQRLLEDLDAAGPGGRLGDTWPVRDRVLVAYVIKLTLEPARMTRQDLEPLRAVGLGDGEILDIVHVAGYYAYANRIADALGIELEEYRRG
jgi:uncharacterized peroxidase-related enzyme